MIHVGEEILQAKTKIFFPYVKLFAIFGVYIDRGEC